MKVIPNIELKGRGGLELDWLDALNKKHKAATLQIWADCAVAGPVIEADPRTVRSEVVDAQWRLMNKALDVLEPAIESGAKQVELEDAWYDLIRPRVLKAVAQWGIHSPFVLDQMQDAIDEATKAYEAKKNGAAPSTKKGSKKS